MATMPVRQAHCGLCARRGAPACSTVGWAPLNPPQVRTAWRRLAPGAQAVQARGCGLRVRAAAAVEEPEVEEPEVEEPDMEDLEVDDLQEDVPQQHKIRIKLKCYFSGPLEDSCSQIIDAVLSTGATVSGPVYLPTRMSRRKRWTVLRSPHVNKDSREQFELRTHSRLIDVKDLTPGTIDELMKLELPAGVDVEVKL